MKNKLLTLLHKRDNAHKSLYEGRGGLQDFVNLHNSYSAIESATVTLPFAPLDIIAEGLEDDTGGHLTIITAVYADKNGSCAYVLLHTEDEQPVEINGGYPTIGDAIAAAREAHPHMFEPIAEGAPGEDCYMVVSGNNVHGWLENGAEAITKAKRAANENITNPCEVFRATRVTGFRKTLEEF